MLNLAAVDLAQGVYVLSDSNFRWLSRVPPAASAVGDPLKEAALRQMAATHLHLPCGIIRGEMGDVGAVSLQVSFV